MRKQLITLLSAILFCFVGFAQTGTVRGFVYAKKDGEPQIFTNVYLKGTTVGATTDENGFYQISKITPGNYLLTVSSIGFDTLEESITIKGGDLLTKKLFISEAKVQLNEFVVSAEKQEAQTAVQMSVTKVTPKEISKIPTVGGEADIAQYLQVLPGVVFTGDQGGQLYIRGGSPIQNMVLLDGMIIYNPFHSIGLFSVFETDIMRNADIYTGGFNAQYGGRISSVMDITTRDGNKKRFSGKLGASTFGSRLILEGPIVKQKESGGGSSSFIVAGKTSYINRTAPILYNYADSGLPFSFNDIYAKASFNGGNGSKFNLFGFRFDDQVNYENAASLDWLSYGGGTNFVLVPGSSAMLIEGNLAYSNYAINSDEGDAPDRFSSIGGFNGGLEFTYFLAKNEINYGINIEGFNTDFSFFNPTGLEIRQAENTTQIGAFFRYKVNLGNLVLDPGLRIQYYASLNDVSPEPRLGLKYNITDNIRLKAAGGFYSQNLISANSARDVVNLFSGFLSGPSNIQDQFMDEDGNISEITHKLQKARHEIVGVEIDITRNLNLNVEGYHKRFSQLSNVNRNKIFEDNNDNRDVSDLLKKDFIVETGDAYGLDFALKYSYKNYYLWAVYSIATVDRYDGIQTYYPVFDRRHNVNLLGSIAFGKDLNWEATARWNFGTGFPFTQTQGFYEKTDLADGLDGDYINSNGEIDIIFAELNGGRLPTYHRMDLNIKRQFVLSENSVLEVTAGATNVYNRRNIFYRDRTEGRVVYQLPVLPSVGLTLTF